MTRNYLVTQGLTKDDARRLAGRLRPSDVRECHALGFSPLMALEHSIAAPGRRVWVVVDSDDGALVGAYGFANLSIWSLWTELSLRDAKEVLRRTPEMVRECLAQSGADELSNVVHVLNEPALKYLDHSLCFNVNRDTVIDMAGENFYGFVTKPLAELPA